MIKAVLIGAALCGLVSTAQAAEKIGLPKEFQGKWCAVSSTTGGGSPRFYSYTRTDCGNDREDSRFSDGSVDIVLGARTSNWHRGGCTAIQQTTWYENNRHVYIVTYRCKDKTKHNAMFDVDHDGNLTAQFMRVDD
jgi:hypothetical protein